MFPDSILSQFSNRPIKDKKEKPDHSTGQNYKKKYYSKDFYYFLDDESSPYKANNCKLAELNQNKAVFLATYEKSDKTFAPSYLDFDRQYALKVNEAIQKEKPEFLRKCACNVDPRHSTKFGSLCFCPRFLEEKDFEQCKQFLKQQECFKCLLPFHSANTCYSKLRCFYWAAGKSSCNHNSTMCTFLTEAEFAAVQMKIDAGKKKEFAYLATIGDEVDSDDEEGIDKHNFMLESSGTSLFEEIFMLETTIEEEIKKCLDKGMTEAVLNLGFCHRGG